MRRLYTLAVLVTALSLCLTGQNAVNRYIATADTTALTVQQPTNGAKQVQFETASVYCAIACTATGSWNGTAASATTLTIKKAPGTFAQPAATAWSDSNAGSGTAGVVYNVPAGGTILFDMSGIYMGTSGTATNYTFTASQAATIAMQWIEK